MEQQHTTTNGIAVGGPVQPEKNMAQQSQPQVKIQSSSENDAKISFLKPELLCISFVGLFHNLSVLVCVLCSFFFWSVRLKYESELKQKYPKRYGQEDNTVAQIAWIVVMHFVGIILSVGAIAMDVFLRGSIYPERSRTQAASTLQIYLILNVTFLIFGFIINIVIFFCLSTFYDTNQLFGFLLSNCLRATYIFIVFKYWTLLGQSPGLTKWGGRHMPIRVHNESPAQAQEPSNQEQTV